ncbi:MAG: peptide ABC transporter substrate-binding protein [Clostridiales bacterium]|nr:peptide ABC transporter substrate-binding protein [Clostridiales bacterium]
MITFFSACKQRTNANKAFAYPISQDPECLDPQIASTDAALTIINNCMEGLFRLDSDGNIINGIAESYSVSEDKLTYTFKLRQNAQWYLFDSSKELLGDSFVNNIDADDFVYALRRTVLKQTNCPTHESFFVIKNAKAIFNEQADETTLGVVAVDKYTLQITLEYPDSSFLELLTTAPAMPCNEEFFLATKGKYGLNIDNFLCNGQFYTSKWNEDASFLIKKNPEYNGEFSAIPSSVNFYINSNTDDIAENIKNSDYDAGILTSTSAQALIKHEKFKYKQLENTVWGLCFNTDSQYLSNTNLRLALAVATFASDIKSSFPNTATGIIPDMCKVELQNYRENALPLAALSDNAAKAQEYWSKATDELGTKTITLTLSCPSEYETNMRTLLQSWQKYFGLSISAKIKLVESSKVTSTLRNGSFDIMFAPMTAENSDTVNFLKSVEPSIHLSSNEFENILTQLKNAKSSADKFSLCNQAENFLIQNALFIPLAFENTYFIQAENVSDIYLYSINSIPCFIQAKREGRK